MVHIECLRCKSPMEDGFIVDHGHGNAMQEQQWVEGEVVKSFWRGVNTKGRDVHKVTTYRCPRCGYLESYALQPEG